MIVDDLRFLGYTIEEQAVEIKGLLSLLDAIGRENAIVRLLKPPKSHGLKIRDQNAKLHEEVFNSETRVELIIVIVCTVGKDPRNACLVPSLQPKTQSGRGEWWRSSVQAVRKGCYCSQEGGACCS